MIGCIIQARMGSTRLPGKILEKVDETNHVLKFLINQLKYSRLLDKIIIATTRNVEDDIIVEFANHNNLENFRGDENNVLNRYFETAKKFSLDAIVRITSDNPLIDPELVDEGIQIFNSKKLDVFTNNQIKSFPYGVVFEIFSFDALERIEKIVNTSSDKEHVTQFFYSNRDKFNIYDLKFKRDLSHIHCSIDTLDDLKFIRELIKKIEKRPILLNDIISAIEKFPELLDINNKN
tara:strand:- start:862 stop:1566 length:705 start_codon:yes stop_codon:yes gene_type:complete